MVFTVMRIFFTWGGTVDHGVHGDADFIYLGRESRSWCSRRIFFTWGGTVDHGVHGDADFLYLGRDGETLWM